MPHMLVITASEELLLPRHHQFQQKRSNYFQSRASAAKCVHVVVSFITVLSLAPQFVELLQLHLLLLVIWRHEARITRLSLATMTNLLCMNSF